MYTCLILPTFVSAWVTVAKGCACLPSPELSSPEGATNRPYSSDITHASVSGLSEPSHGGVSAPPLPAAESVPPSPPMLAPDVPLVPDAPLMLDEPPLPPEPEAPEAPLAP